MDNSEQDDYQKYYTCCFPPRFLIRKFLELIWCISLEQEEEEYMRVPEIIIDDNYMDKV